MISENKFSKYLLYAIGEIILVVIGILIALQINTWNETQQTKEWERRFLNDLSNELKNDQRQLNLVYEKKMTKGDACRKVLELIETTRKEDKAIIDSVYAISLSGNKTFFPTTGVYDAALSAGKIENIRNDSLKYAILNLYNHYYDRLTYNGEVLDEFVGKVDWENKKFWNATNQVIDSWETIQSNDLISQTEYMVAQNQVYTSLAIDNLEQIDRVIELIAIELK